MRLGFFVLVCFFIPVPAESFEVLRLDAEKSFSFPPARCDYNEYFYDIVPPIIMYAYRGLAVLMAKELANGYSPDYVYANKFPSMGYCPLAGAIYAHSYKGVKLLLEAGAYPNIVFEGPLIFNDSRYNTLNTNALSYAICRNVDIKIIKLLLDYGADRNQLHNPYSQRLGLTPIELAKIMGNKKIIQLLLQVGGC